MKYQKPKEDKVDKVETEIQIIEKLITSANHHNWQNIVEFYFLQ